MADTPDQSEKTEEPTQKKLDDAHKKGDVAKSNEVTVWFTMLAVILVLGIFSRGSAAKLGNSIKGFIVHSSQIHLDQGGVTEVLFQIVKDLAGVLFIPFMIFVIMGIGGNLLQHRPLFTGEKLKPKLEKISLIKGLNRIFSTASLMNFLKGILKLILVTFLMCLAVWPDRDIVYSIFFNDISEVLDVSLYLILKMLTIAFIAMSIIAVADYMYQKYKWHQKQKMTVKELKDEYKQLEGNPEVKNKLRQIRTERGRKRMMNRVPDATVVITNPTHYAVALQYEFGMNAPLCVAKGADLVALRIREIARDNDVAVVENPPLARALFASVDIEEEIPVEHYKAVAEIISYVHKLNNKFMVG